jgi:hypothetical protein
MVDHAHAPEVTLRWLILALGAGAMMLAPARFFPFHLFKGKKSR